MDSYRVEQIFKIFESKDTEELIEIWEDNNREIWSAETFVAIKRILTQRGFVFSDHTTESKSELPESKSEISESKSEVEEEDLFDRFINLFGGFIISNWKSVLGVFVVFVVIAWFYTQFDAPRSDEKAAMPVVINMGEKSYSINEITFGIASSTGLLRDLVDGDPLYHEIPDTINLNSAITTDAHVLVQNKPTEMSWKKQYGKSSVFGSRRDLIIDNATDSSILISVDTTRLQILEANSHAIVSLRLNRLYNIKLRNIESVDNETIINLYPLKEDYSGVDIDYFVINYNKANSYYTHYVYYSPIK